jgi:hypothetical protein
LLTGVHRITPVSRQITGFDLRCSLVLTGGVRSATGRDPIGLLGLFKWFSASIEGVIGVTGSIRALDRVRR